MGMRGRVVTLKRSDRTEQGREHGRQVLPLNTHGVRGHIGELTVRTRRRLTPASSDAVGGAATEDQPRGRASDLLLTS
jgi:hypothetical protein